MRRLTTALAVMAVSLALAAPAIAQPAEATLDVVATDALVAADADTSSYVIVGEDFRKNTTVGVAISGETSKGATTDQSGTFTIDWDPAPGTYELTAYQKRGGKGWEVATTITVTVD